MAHDFIICFPIVCRSEIEESIRYQGKLLMYPSIHTIGVGTAGTMRSRAPATVKAATPSY